MERKQPIKVLLLSPLPPPIGGITIWTREYCAKILSYDCTVDVVNTSVIGKRIEQNSNISLIDEFIRIKRIRNETIKHIKNETYDVLHYNSSCFTYGLIKDLFILRGIPNTVPVVYQCHCNLETNISTCFSKWLFQCVVKMCNCVLVLNERSLSFARKYSDNVIKIPNFIEGIICEKKEIKNKITDIVFVGRVSRKKGIYELLGAMKSFPDINLHIIGPDTSEILKDINRKNIKYHGAMEHDQVLKMISDMDVFVLPSYSEGFPLVVLEAMACGLPVIASEVGSIPEMVANGGGIIIDPGSINSIIEAIEKIKSPIKRQQMSDINIDTVKKKYTESIVFYKLYSLYKSIKL